MTTAASMVATPGAAAVLAPAAPGAVPTTPAPSGTPPVVDTTWLGADAPAELVGYVQNKAWKSPLEVLEGYRNLEKLHGAHRLAMPKDDADADGWNKLYDAIGRPKAAAEYKLPVPEGADPGFAKAAAETFHKLGLNTKQATELTKWWNEQAAAQGKVSTEAQEAAATADLAALRGEWGQTYDANIENAKRASRQFGVDSDTATKLEAALGTKGLLSFMAKIGKAIGEHGAEGMQGAAPGGMGLTPAQAQARIAALKTDAVWVRKYTNGDATAKHEMAMLTAAAHPDAKAIPGVPG